MSLEEATDRNTAAVTKLNENFAKLFGAKGATTAAEPATTGGKGGRPPKIKMADVQAMAQEVRKKKDKPTAVKLIKKFGADSVAEMDESNYKAFMEAAKALIEEEEEPAAEEEDDSL